MMLNKAKIQEKFALSPFALFAKALMVNPSLSARAQPQTPFPLTTTLTKSGPFPVPPPAWLVGVALSIAFLVQAFWAWHWPWLKTLQQNELYRQWSGVFLLLYLIGQFLLPLARRYGSRPLQRRYYRWHHWQGALAPLIYYFHSMQLGYAYLLLLSIVYFANVLVGLSSAEVSLKYVTIRNYAYYWLILHISLSLLTVALVFYHIYIVLAYA